MSFSLIGTAGPFPGWTYNIKVGDLVRCQMQSGKTAEFEVIKLNRMSDPKDQYFAKVKDVRYL